MKMNYKKIKEFIQPYLYVGPAWLYMAFFLLLPTFFAIKLSFTHPFRVDANYKSTVSKLASGKETHYSLQVICALLRDAHIQIDYALDDNKKITIHTPIPKEEAKKLQITIEKIITEGNLADLSRNLKERYEENPEETINLLQNRKLEKIIKRCRKGVFPTLFAWKHVWITRFDIWWESFRLTSFYAIVTITLETLFGLFIAILLNMNFRGRGGLRTIVFLPMAIPILVGASSIVVMTAKVGTLNGLLILLHIIPQDAGFTFSASPLPIIFAEVWKVTPYAVLIILAGLEGIPPSLYEAARTMGATHWQQFWRITIPLAWPSILIAFTLRLSEVFKMFAFPFLVGREGWGDVLSTLSWKEHQNTTMRYLFPQSLSSVYALNMVLAALGFLLLLGLIYWSYKLVQKRATMKE